MLRCKANLPLSKEVHDYIYEGLPVTELNWTLVASLWILALGLFLGIKSKISHEQNVKEFQFYMHLQNFRLLGSIIKKYLNLAGSP